MRCRLLIGMLSALVEGQSEEGLLRGEVFEASGAPRSEACDIPDETEPAPSQGGKGPIGRNLR